jgi:2-hydroxycyclohexanecarboxyl-CoA dehydrogenase
MRYPVLGELVGVRSRKNKYHNIRKLIYAGGIRMELERKVAIVTGSGQGIGKAIAIKLAREGANIAVVDLNLETATETVREINELGRKAIAIKTNVSKSDQVNQMAEQTLRELGTVDILVNNAAYLPRNPKPFMEENEAYCDMILAVNLKSVILCCWAVLGTLIKKQSGKIVNIASESGRMGGKTNQALYSTAKGGVIAFTKSIAHEMGRYNINVNSVCPGPTYTESFQATFQKMSEEALKAIPLGRMATPENMADVVAFLCSSASAHMTGQTFSVNGGFTMP